MRTGFIILTIDSTDIVRVITNVLDARFVIRIADIGANQVHDVQDPWLDALRFASTTPDWRLRYSWVPYMACRGGYDEQTKKFALITDNIWYLQKLEAIPISSWNKMITWTNLVSKLIPENM